MFVTMLNEKYNFESHKCTYSSAGHNPLVVYRKLTDTVELCGTKGAAIGFIENYNYRENNFILESGDIIVFYTDGIIES